MGSGLEEVEGLIESVGVKNGDAVGLEEVGELGSHCDVVELEVIHTGLNVVDIFLYV